MGGGRKLSRILFLLAPPLLSQDPLNAFEPSGHGTTVVFLVEKQPSFIQPLGSWWFYVFIHKFTCLPNE